MRGTASQVKMLSTRSSASLILILIDPPPWLFIPAQFTSHQLTMSILHGASHIAIHGGTHVAARGSTVTINQGGQAGSSSAFKDLSAAAAHTALHDSAARFDAPRCHRNTRAKFRDRLELWMLGEGEDLEGKRLIWFHGGAGAGKSAIMQSVVEQCTQHGVILGAFFFSRTDPSRNYAEVLVPTLAYQLACAFPAVMVVLEPVIQGNPLIFTASLHTQAYELIVRPLLYLLEAGFIENTNPFHGVFVVDGLDECTDQQKQALIIQIVASILCKYRLPICFVIASRPELAINSAFQKEKQLLPIFTSISLDDDDNAESDIRQFVEDSFLDILDSHPWRGDITLPWPGADSVDHIVSKSSGHFIYAAIAMRFIMSSDEHPSRALEVVKGLEPSRTGSPFAELDALYMHILTSAKYNKQVLEILRQCYLANFPNTLTVLCYINEISPADIPVFLSDIQSLVSLVPDEMGEIWITPKHASLGDFLINEERSQLLYRAAGAYHGSLLARYIQLLDNGVQTPKHSFYFQMVNVRSLIYGLVNALVNTEDTNLLLSVVSRHTPHDIWNLCVESFELDTRLSLSDIRRHTTDLVCEYISAIRDSIAPHDHALYFQQFAMYIELVLDDINDFVDRKPQYRVIPALMFSSGHSGLFLAHYLLDCWSRQFQIHTSYRLHFMDPLLNETYSKIDPRSFQAIKSLPQSQMSWSSDLAITMKLVLQQLVKISWTPELLYPNPHTRWLRNNKPSKHLSLGSPKVSSNFYAYLCELPESLLLLHEGWLALCVHGYSQGHADKINNRRIKCFVLLKAVTLYLHKSDCTSEIANLARKTLPKATLWFPKLTKRVRAEMDAYVRRWEESLEGLLETTNSLSINNID
ncbi:hypothetical protein D9619_002248 [Psilocybe cf. subviscida]|uniref:Nephrocystin 3-like N-terminal domain-containing protein n=1 Tax=Psilocybe cf. subviscida TaxID=2480587 RepID=A0A8H5BEZ0_9AGAR|nr:hypothetical protein D9619_002248 [Psilocybe cf. subviscida]